MKIINLLKREINSLSNKQKKSHEKMQKPAAFADLKRKSAGDKEYRKVRDHCHHTAKFRGTEQYIFNLRYSIPKEMYFIMDQAMIIVLS